MNSAQYNFSTHCFITVPQRLLNTQCGADYSVVGSTNSFSDYIEPATIVSYKLHPNYFFSSDSDHISTIMVNFFQDTFQSHNIENNIEKIFFIVNIFYRENIFYSFLMYFRLKDLARVILKYAHRDIS